MSELKELIDGYIQERDEARHSANQGWNQVNQWRSIATALAYRIEDHDFLRPLTTTEMRIAGGHNLEVEQQKESIKLVLTPIEEDPDES